MNKEKKTKKEERCLCPYCEGELIVSSVPYCQPCGVVLQRCLRCNITVLDKKATNCPECGEPLRRGGKER